MPIVEVRKNILVIANLNNASEFTFNIDVPFTPDEMIVRNVSVVDVGGAHVYIIKSSLVDYEVLLSMANTDQSTYYQVTHTMNKPINGQFSFKLYAVDGTALVVTSELTIQLEFVRYKKKLPVL